jgi:signal transduction histidine kinase
MDKVFYSKTLGPPLNPDLRLIKKSIDEGSLQEEFGTFQKHPVYWYAFPLQDRSGIKIGGVAILQHTSFMAKDIRTAKWSIVWAILIMMGGTVTLVLIVTRNSISNPIADLMRGIRNLAGGNLDQHIDLKGRSELSELAEAFNQMAIDLKKARERILQEAESRLGLERELRQSEKLATVGQLASELAHEIGTPLNIISGRAELAKKKLDERETTEKNLDLILQQTERITKFIQQLLGFVRRKKPEQKPLAFPDVLDATLDFLTHPIQKQNVRVFRTVQPSLPPVLGDPDQLQQAFLNLLLNAVQAMPRGGELRLSISQQWINREGMTSGRRPYLEACIEDQGVGMGKETLEHLFRPFFTTKDSGTGLGLMVTQGIIQDHEGWIEVESELGKGTVFKIYLPVTGEVSDGKDHP